MTSNSLKFIVFLLMGIFIIGCTPQEEAIEEPRLPAPDPDNAGLEVNEGFSALKVASDLGRIRHIAVRENGDIYANLRTPNDEGGLVALRDTTNDGRADIVEYFTEVSGTGLAIYNGYLYYSSDSSVLRRKFNGNELVPSGEEELIAGGFEYRPQHAAKSITFDGQGNMYVNVGAPSNACQEEDRKDGSPGQDPCPLLEKFGGIWQFNATQLNQDQMADGHRYATGLRNCVGIRWNPVVDKLFVVQHGRDMLHNWYPDTYSKDDPAEELFLVEDGDDFGWPYCYYDYEDDRKVLNPEYGGDGDSVGQCADKKDPVYAFPGHWGPNDLLFYTADQFPGRYQNGVFVAFHGSWNRTPEQQGYNIVFVPFNGDQPTGDFEVFAGGFTGTDTLESPGDAVYRPTGVATGPDGSLYVSDDQGGTLFRIYYQGVGEEEI